MSSDLLEDCVDNRGVDCSLTTNVNSYAWLSIYDCTATFELAPDVNGIRNAQSIIDALRSWIAHTQNMLESCYYEEGTGKPK